MGIVYSAHDPNLNRVVALKIVRPEQRVDEMLARFRDEALAASALNHPNIITIYDFGEHEGAPFITSELVEGRTLREVLQAAAGRMPIPDILDIARQITSALAAAHRAGIVHRDIKPENVMIRPDGYVKVLDFGLAKRSGPIESGIESPTALTTSPGVMVGTVLYMAPEQVRGLPVDGRVDVWATGCVLYQMVTGSPPFSGVTGADIVAAVLEREPAPVEALRKDCPPVLGDLIRRALTKDRDRRVQSMEELQDALRAVPTGAAAPADPSGSANDVTGIVTALRDAPQQVRATAGDGTARTATTSRRALLTGVAGIAVAVVLTALALRSAPAPSSTVPGPPLRTLDLWLTVQKMRDGLPYQAPFVSSGQEIFENGWKFRLHTVSQEGTYLYVLNEGPAQGGETTLHLLFPTPNVNDGSARLAPGVPMESGWYVFTEHQGTERFWLVAAPSALPELEDTKHVVNPENRGLIGDAAQRAAVDRVLRRGNKGAVVVRKDSTRKHTTLQSADALLVHLMELEHH